MRIYERELKSDGNSMEAIDAKKELFADTRPVDTIMVESRFVNPRWLVELEADAVIGGREG